MHIKIHDLIGSKKLFGRRFEISEEVGGVNIPLFNPHTSRSRRPVCNGRQAPPYGIRRPNNSEVSVKFELDTELHMFEYVKFGVGVKYNADIHLMELGVRLK